MSKEQHEENLAVIRGGQGVTVGAGYYTTVPAYCEAHELDIPEQDQEPEPDAEPEQDQEAASAIAELPGQVFLELGEGEHEGLVRKVYLEGWREEAEGDRALEGVVTFAPEVFDAQMKAISGKTAAIEKKVNELGGKLKSAQTRIESLTAENSSLKEQLKPKPEESQPA